MTPEEAAGLELLGSDASTGEDAHPPAVSFEDLYRTYHRRVAGVVRRRVVDRHQQEDIVQETFLRAWRRLHTVDSSLPLWPWLATIASNTAIDSLRSRPHPLPAPGAPVPSAAGGRVWDPAEAYESGDRAAAVRDALRQLPPRYRRVLLFKDLEGWSCEDISALEGLSEDAVRSVLKRARQTFRSRYMKLLRQRGLLSLLLPVLLLGQRRLRQLRARTQRTRFIVNAAWQQIQYRAAAALGLADGSFTLPQALQVAGNALVSAAVVCATVLGTIDVPVAQAEGGRSVVSSEAAGLATDPGLSPRAPHGPPAPVAATGVARAGREDLLPDLDAGLPTAASRAAAGAVPGLPAAPAIAPGAPPAVPHAPGTPGIPRGVPSADPPAIAAPRAALPAPASAPPVPGSSPTTTAPTAPGQVPPTTLVPVPGTTVTLPPSGVTVQAPAVLASPPTLPAP